MKKLFTFVSLMAFTAAMNAQDVSKWEVGQDVAAEIGLKELGDDFTGATNGEDYGHLNVTSTGEVWQGTSPNEYRKSSGSDVPYIGFYNMGEFDFYQIVKVPAGAYTLTANAFYREGTPADNFKNRFNGKKFKNAYMYANLLDDDKTKVTYENQVCIKSIAETTQATQIFSASDWTNDYSYTYNEENKDGETVEKTLWCPSCSQAFCLYFAQGLYPNEKKFVLTKDAYVKIGFNKIASIPQDQVAFANLKVIYDGPADAASLQELAKEEAMAVLNDLEELGDQLCDAGFDKLGGAAQDLADSYKDECRKATTERLVEIKVAAETAVVQYTASKELVLQLADLISSCEDMIESTDFDGKSDFSSVLGTSKDKVAADVVGSPEEYYNKIILDLSTARASYLNNSPTNEKGAKDFGSLIKYPWFVNPEFTPSDDTATGGDFWHLTADTWTNWEGPEAYSTRVKNGYKDISSKVDVSIDKTISGQWFKYQDYNDGWCGGTQLFHHGRLVGFSTSWSTGFQWKDGSKPGIEGVAQRLVGLPNGYYSVGCLVRGWDACTNYESRVKFLGCFAENSNEVRVSSTPSSNTGNWWEWGSSSTSWDDVETSVLTVEDGKLLIGGGGSISNTVTGFRLYFYGANPDFPGLAQKKANELAALSKSGFFPGDTLYLANILASVQHPVSDAAAYDEAYNKFTAYQKYYSAVSKKMAGFKALSILNDIPETWANPAYNYVDEITKSESATYEKVDELNALANAYKAYQTQRYASEAYNSDAVVKELLDSQKATLSAAMSTVDALNAYVEALKAPTRLLELKDLGCATATEANPAAITSVLANPTFEESLSGTEPKTDVSGWSEEPATNAYARGNGELWNKDAFTFSQKIANLPAGTYKLRVKAIYRNSGAVSDSLKTDFETAGDEANWKDNYAKLFARTSETNIDTAYIKSIYRINQKSLSFTEVAIKRTIVEGQVVPTQIEIIGEKPEAEKVADCAYYTMNGDKHDQTPFAAGVYPFDSQLGDNYYPASMYGFYMACQNHAEAITSEVKITIEQGETLEVGIMKTGKISGDWVIFDDFELYYLTGDTFARVITSVDSVETVDASNGSIFNLAGQRVNSNAKGIVIDNGVKVLK